MRSSVCPLPDDLAAVAGEPSTIHHWSLFGVKIITSELIKSRCRKGRFGLHNPTTERTTRVAEPIERRDPDEGDEKRARMPFPRVMGRHARAKPQHQHVDETRGGAAAASPSELMDSLAF
jgi:hypothetical protein